MSRVALTKRLAGQLSKAGSDAHRFSVFSAGAIGLPRFLGSWATVDPAVMTVEQPAKCMNFGA